MNIETSSHCTSHKDQDEGTMIGGDRKHELQIGQPTYGGRMTREHLCKGNCGKEEQRRETGVAFVPPTGVVIVWIVKTYFILLFNVAVW